MKEKPFVPQEELARQREFVREIGEAFAGRKTYHIVTLGCQMNVRDSETLAGTLQEMGFAQAERDKADIVLYNTCCVRENAENRALGRTQKRAPGYGDRRLRLYDPGGRRGRAAAKAISLYRSSLRNA